MSNRLFQGVIHQMKDAIDRVIGVIDENGVIIACSELVKIGEIRQGEQGFYLWDAEEIKLTENGVTSTASYQWVYCLEAVDCQMKIVDYINVKNK